MKLLITGGCGFLGSNIAVEALLKGIDVCIYDNLQRVGSKENLEYLKTQGKFLFYEADTRNNDILKKVFTEFKPEVIFHLAGQVAMTTSINNPIEDFTINALGTLNLLENCRKFTPNALVVYSSTNKVYGDLEYFNYKENKTRYICNDLPNGMNENLHLDFQSPYGCSKGAADAYLLDYHRVFGLNTVVFRHSSMYGGRQYATSDQGWIGWFCKEMLDISKSKERKGIISIHGNGKQVRDLLFASDMVDLYLNTIAYKEKISGQAFNIGGGMKNSMSLLELLAFLSDELQIGINIQYRPPRASDQKIFVADISKAISFLNWIPKISNEEGLKKMINWVKTIN